MSDLTQTASTAAQLDAEIRSVDSVSQGGTIAAYTIDIAQDISLYTLTDDLAGVVLGTGSSLTIIGNGHTMSGLHGYPEDRGLFAYRGVLTVEGLTIADADAVGGWGAVAVSTKAVRAAEPA
ncbi:MAG TPA: hypothetical protein VJY39_03060 [Acidisphaera sp.]|nr:hypothetical protein [Acidisphaera sp.]